METVVYIDGFNLYYRLLKDRSAIKWVNPVALAKRVLPKNTIIKVRYFTARVSGRLDAHAPARQQLYFDALSTVPEIEIHYGSFLETKKYAGLVAPVLDSSIKDNRKTFLTWPDVAYVWKTESRPAPANWPFTELDTLLDAFQKLGSVAAVPSNDSDLVEPIRVTNNILSRPVGLLSPVKNPQIELKRVAAFLKHVTPADIAASQFPDPVPLADGSVVFKPPTWV